MAIRGEALHNKKFGPSYHLHAMPSQGKPWLISRVDIRLQVPRAWCFFITDGLRIEYALRDLKHIQ